MLYGFKLLASICMIIVCVVSGLKYFAALLHEGQFRMNSCSWLPGMSGMLGVRKVGRM